MVATIPPDPQQSWVFPEPALVPVLDGGTFMATTRELDRFAGRWHKLRDLAPERLTELQRVATIESVASSTRIEGAELSDEEVGRILSGLSIDSFRARDEQEVRGYHDLLELIFEQYRELHVTENSLKEFHRILLQYSEKDRHHRGEYKSRPNDVEARHPDGRREIVFRTAPTAETQWWMPRLIDEFNVAWTSNNWHPLVLIADFVLWLLALHPFQDGNGRLSRALTTLLLLKAEYDYVPYVSLERVIEDNKARYYEALRTSQMAVRKNPRDYSSWLTFFLRAMHAQQERLDQFVMDATRRASLAPAQQRILELITAGGPSTSSAISESLNINQRTVRYHLAQLTKKGLLESTQPISGRLYGLPVSEQPKPSLAYAEGAIRQGAAAKVSGDLAPESAPETDSAWIGRYYKMVKLAFDAYVKDNDWPEVTVLQRTLDRDQTDIDVRRALRLMPRSPGEQYQLEPTRVFIPLRILCCLREADGVIDVCFELVQRAVEVYFSEATTLQISNEDPFVATSLDKKAAFTAARLLLSDFPTPFAGGGYGDTTWTLNIGETVREFRDLKNKDDFFDRQRTLRQTYQDRLRA